MTEEDILHHIERESRSRTEAVRALLLEVGRRDVLIEFDRNMRELHLGLTAARNCWHSISPAQRRVLEMLGTGRWLMREPFSKRWYEAHGEPHAVRHACDVRTVRALAAHELVAWDGGLPDPETKAVLTERGAFVLKHGAAQ